MYLRTTLALLGVLALSGPASALQITGIAVTATANNTADALTDIGANRQQVASSAGLTASSPGPVADVLGASVGFDSRYAFLLAADREAGGGSTSLSAVSEYTITFTVDNPSGGLYQLDIDTSRIGALTLVDDGSGNASATLGALLGQLDAVVDPTLGLAAQSVAATSGGADVGFSQSTGTLSLLETAVSRTYTLTFTWSSSVTSAREEAAIRMGLAGLLTDATADDYPGSAAADGHHVGVVATLIPEPAPSLLLLLSLLALPPRRAGPLDRRR